MNTRVTDLAFLKNFAKDDLAVYEKFIRIFLAESTSLIRMLQEKMNGEDWAGIETISHTLRSQFNFMGIKKGEELLKALRENAMSRKNIAEANGQVAGVLFLFNGATKELEGELNFLENSRIRF